MSRLLTNEEAKAVKLRLCSPETLASDIAYTGAEQEIARAQDAKTRTETLKECGEYLKATLLIHRIGGKGVLTVGENWPVVGTLDDIINLLAQGIPPWEVTPSTPQK